MTSESNQKVTAGHLTRNAYLYVRQSTPRQVLENTESTVRQYQLRRRAIALGWPENRVIVIDSDLGHSAGAAAADREGFQKLVTEVGMNRAGIVMGIEVSRLARNNADWHRLLEICSLTDTLILDEDGIYDPAHFNDRLLLGLKGTMSEAELHMIHARMRGCIENKARRGELCIPLPVGLVYDASEKVVLAPDKQVRECIRLFFETFRRTGAALATVKYFREQGLKFPRRARWGPNAGEVAWGDFTHARALEVLHNPRYAGAYVYGRNRWRKKVDGKPVAEKVPKDEWRTVILDAHPGYISWQEYEDNLRQLRANAQAYGCDRQKSPPREGSALLQGLVVCGICGASMTVQYNKGKDSRKAHYICQKRRVEFAEPICQSVVGTGIDEAVGQLLIEAVTPLALEVSLNVQQELQSRIEELDRLRRRQVERAQYEVGLARSRYMQVDPNNRLVADALEADWNNKLRALADAREEYERQINADRLMIDEEQRSKILALATDFPKLWSDPKTPNRERKRMVRLLIEDVTLIRNDEITAHVRFKGGTTRSLILPLPLYAWELTKTSDEVVAEIDKLLDQHTDGQVADILNERGFKSGAGKTFNSQIIKNIRRHYGLKSLYVRLREAGMLTPKEIQQKLGVSVGTLRIWTKSGLLKAHKCFDRAEYLYENPGDELPIKQMGKKLEKRRRFSKNTSDRLNGR